MGFGGCGGGRRNAKVREDIKDIKSNKEVKPSDAPLLDFDHDANEEVNLFKTST